MFYNFNPNLQKLFNLIHPLQLKYVRKLTEMDFPRKLNPSFYSGEVFSFIAVNSVIVRDDEINVLEKVQTYIYERYRTIGKHCDIFVASEVEHNEWRKRNDFDSVNWHADNNGVVIYGETEI